MLRSLVYAVVWARLDLRLTRTPTGRAPRANAVAERVIGTLRRDCLDHVIPVDERHLRTVLAEFADYDNTERPHRVLRLETPRPAARSPTGAVLARPVLARLQHAYARAA